jgi:hypothetical protein
MDRIAEDIAGMFLAVSFDGGQTWFRRIVGEGNDIYTAAMSGVRPSGEQASIHDNAL